MYALAVWWTAARPKTLWAGVAPVVVGTALAVAAGAAHWPSALAALAGAVLIQVGTNFFNDYADYKIGADTPARQGPLRITQAGLVSPQSVLAASVLVFAAAGVVAWFLYVRAGWPVLAIGGCSIASGIWYTAGRYSAGYLGLGDLFVLVFFGPVAVAGTYYVQALAFDATAVLAGLGPGLLSVAILVVNNVRDMEGDARAGKKTLVVRFGRGFGRVEYLLCLIGAALVPVALVSMTGRGFGALAASAALLPAAPAVRTVFTKTDGASLNPVLGATARLLLVYSVLFALGWCWTS